MQNQNQGYAHHSGGHKLSERGWHHSGPAGRSTGAVDVYSPHHWPRSDISWPKRYQACPLGCWTLSCISQTLSCTRGHSALWQCGATTSSWGRHVLLVRQCGDPVVSGKLLCICTRRQNQVNEEEAQRAFCSLLFFLWWYFSMKSFRNQGTLITWGVLAPEEEDGVFIIPCPQNNSTIIPYAKIICWQKWLKSEHWKGEVS